MTRISLGLAALTLAALTACGTTPGNNPEQTPQPSPAETTAPTPTATATPDDDSTPTASATPDDDSTATPNGTATATPTATATATAAALALPQRVESFNRVEQRTENGTQIGSFYSDGLKTVIEVRAVRGQPARTLLTSLGGTNPATVGSAECSSQGDTICTQENAGVTVAVISKELPATMVANLASKALDELT